MVQTWTVKAAAVQASRFLGSGFSCSLTRLSYRWCKRENGMMRSERDLFVELNDAIREMRVTSGLECELVHLRREAIVVHQERILVTIIRDCRQMKGING